MKILVCGCFLPRQYEAKLEYLSVAANQYQNNLIQTLEKKHMVRKMSYIGFPVEVTDTEETQLIRDCKKDGYIPYIAKEKIETVLQFRKKLRKMLQWADLVITYNSVYPWYGIGRMAQQYGKRSVLILADYTSAIEEKGTIKKLKAVLMQQQFSRYSKVILLSNQTKGFLKKNQEYKIINGCLEENLFNDLYVKKQNHHKIMITYTGMLRKITGIDLLLEAFSMLDENYYLTITGQGKECDELIRKYAFNNPRIDYRGLVPQEEYRKVIAEADILVNPRNMNYIQNQYNFPSKVIEYLASGRRIVSTKFRGWSKYEDVVCFADPNPESIAQAIQKASQQDEELVFRQNIKFAQRFSWDKQIDRFL